VEVAVAQTLELVKAVVLVVLVVEVLVVFLEQLLLEQQTLEEEGVVVETRILMLVTLVPLADLVL
jgi:hypothetical protein